MPAAPLPHSPHRVATITLLSLAALTVCALLWPPPTIHAQDLTDERTESWLRSVRIDQERARSAADTLSDLAAALAAIRDRHVAELVATVGRSQAAGIAVRAPLLGVSDGRVVAVDLDGHPLTPALAVRRPSSDR